MAHRHHVDNRCIDHRNKQCLEHDFLHQPAVLLLVLFAIHFFEVSELPEVVQMKKTEDDAESVPDLKV